jgi:predicted AAA+ superfamily ATPase
MPPAVLQGDVRSRRRWYLSYLDQLVTRDAAGIAGGRDPVRLRRYVDVLAENTAGLPSESALLDAGAINARTASDYDRLLQSLGVLDIVPAWSTNRLKRLTQRGKRYLTDTGLTAGALRVDAADLLREGDLLGRIIDTYVTAQIRAEIAASELLPNLFHLRDRDGHEVDLLLDYGRRGLIGVEIKASASPTRADAAHLWWLQEHVPDFRAGLVLHTGSKMYRLYDGIAAVPIAALWT